jgi:hypothetical protein
MIHFLLRSPGLVVMTAFSVCLVAGLIVSDWAEKRRQRKWRDLIEQSRAKSGYSHKIQPASSAHASLHPAHAGQDRKQPPYKPTRRRFAFAVILCIATALVLIQMDKPNSTVRARENPDAKTPGAGPSAMSKPDGEKPDGTVSLWYTNEPAHADNPLTLEAHPDWLWNQKLPSSEQIDVSSPQTPLTDPDDESAVDLEPMKFVHPDAPQQPVRIRQLP